MAEFLDLETGKNHFASKGMGNAGVTLGVIGTALGALNSGILGGNGILGIGNRGFSPMNAMVDGAEAASIMGLASRENADQQFDIYQIQQAKIDALKWASYMREKDVAEKADVYRQSLSDNRNLESLIRDTKDFAITGLADVYKASAISDAAISKQMADDKFESYKNLVDVYTAGVKSDKELELQIERNREADQNERFALYKTITDKTNCLAYEQMKQSYEDRIEGMKQVGALAERVSVLEKKNAVNEATIPLYFQLSKVNTDREIAEATCKKIDGHLTLSPCQISSPCFPVL